ncbi:SAM-dependent methyltransferase [Pararhizobium haloflavum]|uniref:SAM-dependent methyltransferase n=1 Tax=Pararhizobium haloflavum TaxID=2037914 RepID=UPI000C17719E|nr:SAM-dependent methyltransferase [Pararhizobium haloflavum]
MNAETNDAFSADWLALREPADNAARNSDVRQAFANYLSSAEDELRLIDMGCGTGSTVRALAPFLSAALPGVSQRWLLCDADALLLSMAREQTNDLDVAITFTTVDLASQDAVNDLIGEFEPDVVTGSALIDLVSADWLDRMLAHAVADGFGLYFALNYSGEERWLPAHPLDAAILAAFNRDQRRDKGFGHALGGEAAGYLAKRARERGLAATIGPSDWDLGQDEVALRTMLAEGIANAAVAGGAGEGEAAKWLDDRRRSEQAVVGHFDIFVG